MYIKTKSEILAIYFSQRMYAERCAADLQEPPAADHNDTFFRNSCRTMIEEMDKESRDMEAEYPWLLEVKAVVDKIGA
jgi:hypothetical protein